MKNALFLTTALAVFALASNAMADNVTTSVKAKGKIKAKIVAPVTMTEASDAGLNFGTMMGNANSVTVDVAGNRTATSTGSLVSDSNSPSADIFEIKGPANTKISVTLPDSTVVYNSNSKTMDVSNFVGETSTSGSSPAKTKEVTIGTDGTAKLYVGGTLTVGDTQEAGDYTGDYTVTATY